MLEGLNKFLPDAPPGLVFELGEGWVVGARVVGRSIEARAERPLAPGTLKVSLAEANVVGPEALRAAIEEIIADLAPLSSPDVALILPDACSRLTVFEFDDLPSKKEDLDSLLRFRLAKTVPFDAAAARLSYQVQRLPSRKSILVAATPHETLYQYEQIFRDIGLSPVYVSISSCAALNLVPDAGMSVIAKMSGESLTIFAIQEGIVRLIRTIERPVEQQGSGYNRGYELGAEAVLPQTLLPEMVSDLYPTFVYIEDHLGTPVQQLSLSGFEDLLQPAMEYLPTELNCEVEPLRSSEGVVGAKDAGIWGYLRAA